MKNILYILLFGCLAVSCQKELSFDPNNTTTPAIDFPNTNDSCFTCDYFPVCDSTQQNYIDSMSGTVQTRTLLYDVKTDTVVNGITFKKILNLTDNTMNYYSCTNNVLKIYAPSSTSIGGTQASNITQTPLKSNEPVGTNWKDVLQINGATFEYRYTIIEKGITRQVLDSTYNNVINVRDTAVTIVPLMGEVPFAVRNSYYARGIGLVEVRMIDLMSGQTSLVTQLKSYHFR